MPRSPITLLCVGLVAVALGYASVLSGTAPGVASWCLAIGPAAILTAMLRLGGRRAGELPRTLRATSALAFVALLGGFGYALAAPPAAAEDPLLLGLPRVTAALLLLAGLVPLIILPVAYARAFDRDVLGEEDVARVRERARAAMAREEASDA